MSESNTNEKEIINDGSQSKNTALPAQQEQTEPEQIEPEQIEPEQIEPEQIEPEQAACELEQTEPEQTEPELAVASEFGKPKKKDRKREIMSWITTIVAAVLIALLLRSFVFIVVRVDGSSMLNTLHNENQLFVWRAGYIFGAPERGDIIICHYPDGSGNYTSDANYVKRVVGLPGDKVQIIEGYVYINGEKLDEPYIDDERRDPPERTKYYNYSNITLGEDEYFVMGDNRANSRDSRYVGPIKRDQILGKAIWKIYPFDEFGQRAE